MSTDNPVRFLLGSEVSACPSTGGLKNLAAGAYVAGPEIDNTNGYQYADFKLKVRGADVFHAGDVVSVWLLRKLGGVYEDGSASVVPARSPDFVIPVRLVNTQQVVEVPMRILPPGPFTTLVGNTTNHALTNTDDENVLTYIPYNDCVIVP